MEVNKEIRQKDETEDVKHGPIIYSKTHSYSVYQMLGDVAIPFCNAEKTEKISKGEKAYRG